MADKVWYYEKDGGSTGPVSEDVIIELIDHGIITKDTLVWRSPLDKWVTAIEVKAFKPKLQDMHTPPPLPNVNNQSQTLPQVELPQDGNPFQTPGSTESSEQNPFESSDQEISIPIERNLQIERTINLENPIYEPTAQKQTISDYKGEDGVYVNQVRPWVRYFARQYDYFTITMLAVAVSLFTIMDPVGLSTMSYVEFYISTFVICFVWIFIEALFLSLYGKTPGKYVFGITVLNVNEKKLSYAEALGRSFKVWAKGMGMALPIVTLIANLFGLIHLNENKITSWDKDSKSATIHDQVSILWIIFYPILVILIFSIACIIAFYTG